MTDLSHDLRLSRECCVRLTEANARLQAQLDGAEAESELRRQRLVDVINERDELRAAIRARKEAGR